MSIVLVFELTDGLAAQVAEKGLLCRMDAVSKAPGSGINLLSSELLLEILSWAFPVDVVQFGMTCWKHLNLCNGHARTLGLLDIESLRCFRSTERPALVIRNAVTEVDEIDELDMCSAHVAETGLCVLSGGPDGTVSYVSERQITNVVSLVDLLRLHAALC